MARKRPDPWRNRIVGEADVDPAMLRGHPQNWRRHPDRQRAAINGVLDSIGWVQRILVNRTTGRVIDGHLRLEEAFKRGETTVPVVYVELTESEEKTALATLDPIGALADTDDKALRMLLEEIDTANPAIQEMLDSLASPAILSDYAGEDTRTMRNQIGRGTLVVSIGRLMALIDRDRVIALEVQLGDDGQAAGERVMEILEAALGTSD